jgi:hypothetical protein
MVQMVDWEGVRLRGGDETTQGFGFLLEVVAAVAVEAEARRSGAPRWAGRRSRCAPRGKELESL